MGRTYRHKIAEYGVEEFAQIKVGEEPSLLLAQSGRKDLLPVALDVVRANAIAIYRVTFGNMTSRGNFLVPSKEAPRRS